MYQLEVEEVEVIVDVVGVEGERGEREGKIQGGGCQGMEPELVGGITGPAGQMAVSCCKSLLLADTVCVWTVDKDDSVDDKE